MNPADQAPRALVSSLVACCLLLGAALESFVSAAEPARVDETLFSDFDLATWRQLGLLDITGSELDRGSVEDLIDRRAYTQARTAVDNPARFTLTFGEAQIVRRVAVRPGTPDPYAISCTVVQADGARFAAGEFVVADNDATFRLRDVAVTALEISVERLESDVTVHLAEIRVAGMMSISNLVLDDLPAKLPEGGTFRLRVLGTDSYGGRPDLTSISQLVATPARAVTFIDRNHALARVGGPLQLSARFGDLLGPPQPILVTALGPPPAAPECRPSTDHVELRTSTPPPFEVLRRVAGEKDVRSLGTTYASVFLDLDVEPGAAYQYSLRRVDRFGNPLSAPGDEGRVRCSPRLERGALRLNRVPVLLVLYTDSLVEGEEAKILASLEAARAFIYRHTGGQLVLECDVLRIAGPTPSTAGPSMAGIEADLRKLGLPDDVFALVHAASNDMVGSFGKFKLLDRTGGSLGRRASVATPTGTMGPDPDFAWVFVHEFWHSFVERAAASVGRVNLPSGHPADDLSLGLLGSTVQRPFDAGEAWDAHAALLSRVDFWSELAPPFVLPLSTRDTDGDGLPDGDSRLPYDELRFGSDPNKADTDGDGLSDLDELRAGLFTPSAPLLADTDGDEIPDGQDAQPLLLVADTLAYGEPAAFAAGPDPRLPEVELRAGWTETGLQLRLEVPEPANIYLDLDGSGLLGRWETDVAHPNGGSDVYAGRARLSLRAFDEPRGLFRGAELIEGGHCEAQRGTNGRWIVEARIPADPGAGATDAWHPNDAPLVAGLRLTEGTTLGLAFTLRPSIVDDPKPFEPYLKDSGWVSLFETHRFVDARLGASEMQATPEATPPATPPADTTPPADATPPENAADPNADEEVPPQAEPALDADADDSGALPEQESGPTT